MALTSDNEQYSADDVGNVPYQGIYNSQSICLDFSRFKPAIWQAYTRDNYNFQEFSSWDLIG